MQSYFFFLKSYGESLISSICVSAATDKAAVVQATGVFVFSSSNIMFSLRHAFQEFSVCNALLV